MSIIESMFFPNGNVITFKDGEQQPSMAFNFVIAQAKRIEAEGFDPTEATYRLPDGAKAKVFRTSEGGLNYECLRS